MLRYQHMQEFKELMIRKIFRCNVDLIRSESHTITALLTNLCCVLELNALFIA